MRSIIITAVVTIVLIGAFAVDTARRSSDPLRHLARDPSGPALAQAYRILSGEHLTPVAPTELIRGAINGMLDVLNDPYSTYSDPLETQRASELSNVAYEGIGISVAPSDRSSARGALILNVTPGGPAERAGLQAGDIITHVDGHDITSAPITDITHRIRGATGTSTTLRIDRPGHHTPITATITREPLTINSIHTYSLDDTHVIHISSFSDGVGDELRRTLERLPPTTERIILDLRDNPGGYLTEATRVADAFLPSGAIVLERARGDTRTLASARAAGTTDLALVVLVNRFSASAAEVVAAALQHHQRATIVGETTFGKGVAQSTAQLMDGGTLTYTILEWLPPNEAPIHQRGVTPDIITPDSRYPSTVVTLSGAAAPGATLTLLLDDQPIGSVTASPDGTISFTATTPPDATQADAILAAALALEHDAGGTHPTRD